MALCLFDDFIKLVNSPENTRKESALESIAKIKLILDAKIDFSKKQIETLILFVNKLLNISNELSNDSIVLIVQKLVVSLKEKNIYWPQLKKSKIPQISEIGRKLEEYFYLNSKEKVAEIKEIEVQAPKFYEKSNERQFNRKEELKKLKERQRRIKKKLISEISTETRLKLDKKEKSFTKTKQENIKKHNQYENMIQQQKKVLEKELTGQSKTKTNHKRKSFKNK